MAARSVGDDLTPRVSRFAHGATPARATGTSTRHADPAGKQGREVAHTGHGLRRRPNRAVAQLSNVQTRPDCRLRQSHR